MAFPMALPEGQPAPPAAGFLLERQPRKAAAGLARTPTGGPCGRPSPSRTRCWVGCAGTYRMRIIKRLWGNANI